MLVSSEARVAKGEVDYVLTFFEHNQDKDVDWEDFQSCFVGNKLI
jgi:hypothetical protein